MFQKSLPLSINNLIGASSFPFPLEWVYMSLKVLKSSHQYYFYFLEYSNEPSFGDSNSNKQMTILIRNVHHSTLTRPKFLSQTIL